MMWVFKVGDVEFDIYEDGEDLKIDIFYKKKTFIEEIFLDDFLNAIWSFQYGYKKILIGDVLRVRKSGKILKFERDVDEAEEYMVFVLNYELFIRKLREILLEIVRKKVGYILSFLFYKSNSDNVFIYV